MMDFASFPSYDDLPDLSRIEQGWLKDNIRGFGAFETQRLVVRPFYEEDAQAVLDVFSPEVVKWFYVLPQPFHYSDAQDYVNGMMRQHSNGTGVGFLIRDRQTDRNIQPIGVMRFVCDSRKSIITVGFAVNHSDSMRNKGYTTEATRSLMQRLGAIGIKYAMLTADPQNKASQCVMKKVGFRDRDKKLIEVTDVNGKKCPRLWFCMNMGRFLMETYGLEATCMPEMPELCTG